MVESIKKKSPLDVLAQVLRVLTLPSLLVSVLLVILYALDEGVFNNATELILALVFLAVMPLLAYPLAYAVPKLRKKGREAQRKLAFITSLIGYIGAVAYGVFSGVSLKLFFIFSTYLSSVIVLMLFNQIGKLRASGHACGVTGPLLFGVYFMGLPGFFVCLAIAVAVVWSSLRIKRHTVSELALGAATALVAFILGYILLIVL